MTPTNTDSGSVDIITSGATTVEEQTLLRHITQGDTTAFWRLWDMYGNALLSRYSLQWMGANLADAEDALSSSSVKAWQHLIKTPRDIVCAKNWMIRILHNHCTDVWKARQRHVRYVQGVTTGLTEGKRTAKSAQESTEETILRDELGTCIRRAFESLPSRLRAPSLLRFVHEMPYDDIAAQLHLRSDTVRKRIQQARVLMQVQLTPYCSDEWNALSTAPAPMTLTTAPLDTEPELTSSAHAACEEITAQSAATCAVRVFLPGEVEKHLYLTLDHKPRRQQQKVDTLRTYVRQHPGGWKKYRALGDMLYTMGQWDEARAAYRQVVRKRPDCLAVWLRLGQMLDAIGRTEDAITAYERAMSLARNPASQHHLEGLIAACRRHVKSALQAFEAASALEPANLAHWHALGLTHMQAAHPLEALQAFDTVLQHHPDDLVALTYSHDALQTVGRDAEAQRRAARAVELDPDNVLALTHLANHLTDMGQGRGPTGTQSRQLIRRALQLAPHSPEAHASRVQYHMSRGEWRRGLTELQQFTTQHPTSPAGWYDAA